MATRRAAVILQIRYSSRVSAAVRLLLKDPDQFAKRMRGKVNRYVRARRAMRPEYRNRFAMTLRDWLLYHHREVLFRQCSWMGVPTLKNPLDAWILQELVSSVRPEVIVEIGSARGGSTLYFANLLDLLGNGCVISVDVDRSGFQVKHPRIMLVTGDSTAASTVQRVTMLCEGKSVLVVHDGGHEKSQVLRDLRAYAPLVPVGGYLVVEDGIIDLYNPGDGIGTYEDGPLVAIEEFLAENPAFVTEPMWERYILTYNPKGYLRRLR